MNTIAIILVALVAFEHIYILVLEMFLWNRPRTLKVFGIPPENAEVLKPMAANQGLYNGFLAAGLIWSLVHPNTEIGQQLQLFFLSCVLIAAIYGSFTVKRSIILMPVSYTHLTLPTIYSV